MMSSVMRFSVPILFILTTSMCVQSESKSLERTEPNEQASYHLRMLKENIDRMKRSWNTQESSGHPSHIFKRSTTPGADDLILNSLSSYCHTLKDDPEIAEYLEKSSEQQPLKFRDVSEFSRYEPEKNTRINGGRDIKPSSTTFPARELNALPIKILAQRDKNTQNVWYIFHIAHSNAVEIARIDPFEFQKSTLRMPKNSCHKIVSQARFEVNDTKLPCLDSHDSRHLKDRLATFQITDEGDPRNVITVSLDVCRFDMQWDDATVKFIAKYETITSVKPVPIPTFFISQSYDPTNENIPYQNITDNDDQEMTIDVGVKLSTSGISIHLALWDTRFTNVVQTSAVVYNNENENEKVDIRYKKNGEIVRGNYNDTEDRLFTLKVIGKSSSVTTLRIILNQTQVENKRGRLTLSNRISKPSKYEMGPLIRKVRVDRNFPINTIDSDDIPEGLIYFGSKRRFFCDKDGDMTGSGIHDDMDTKHCTIKCEAFGRDISAIYITAPQSLKRRVQLTSLVLSRKATALTNLGTASNDIEGDYMCTVVNIRGESKTQELKLYTSRFVKVKSFKVVEEYSEGVCVLCEVESLNKDVDIAISASEKNANRFRLDNVDGLFLEKNITDDGKTISMSLLFSWEHLKIKDTIHCDARGETGEDTAFVYIDSAHLHAFRVPKIHGELLKIKTFPHNSTISATCVASGKKPIVFRLRSSYYGGPLRDMFMPTINKWSEEIGDTVRTTYNLHSFITEHDGILTCLVQNNYGIDEMRFSM